MIDLYGLKYIQNVTDKYKRGIIGSEATMSDLENKTTEVKNQPRKKTFSSGQVSGITELHRQSLYRYVKDFPEFFSETARQHKQGRRWTREDLEMIQAIRCLYHERTGKEKIREMIKGGWRLVDSLPWTRELQSRLIEMTLAAYEESKEISNQAIESIDDLQYKTSVAEGNNKSFAALWIQVQDLKDEWKALEDELRIRGRVRKSFKPRWHGEPPTLFLQPVEGDNLKQYRQARDDQPPSPTEKKP